LIINIEGTPILVVNEAKVTLLPVDHGNSVLAVGLIFTWTEFNKLVYAVLTT
jgi:hypothetical protein